MFSLIESNPVLRQVGECEFAMAKFVVSQLSGGWKLRCDNEFWYSASVQLIQKPSEEALRDLHGISEVLNSSSIQLAKYAKPELYDVLNNVKFSANDNGITAEIRGVRGAPNLFPTGQLLTQIENQKTGVSLPTDELAIYAAKLQQYVVPQQVPAAAVVVQEVKPSIPTVDAIKKGGFVEKELERRRLAAVASQQPIVAAA